MLEWFEVNGRPYEAEDSAGIPYPLDDFENDMNRGTSGWGYGENPYIQTKAGELSVWVISPDLPYTILAEIDRNKNLIWFLTADPE